MFSILTTMAEQHTFLSPLECRFLLQAPEPPSAQPLVVVALNGYSSNPEAMFRPTTGLVGDRHVIASIQAPNQHYVADGLPNAQSVAGYNWGIRPHWESSVLLHHQMLRQGLESLRDRFEVGPERCLLLGFWQPGGLNHRFLFSPPYHVPSPSRHSVARSTPRHG